MSIFRTTRREGHDPSMLAGLAKLLVRNGDLVREMFWRDLKVGHAGHSFGGIWVYLHPIVIVGTYLIIFGFVLGSKIAVASPFPGDYPSYILIGLVPWLITAAVLGRGPSVLFGAANLVKQVVFPVEVLPVAITLVCFMTYIPAA